MGVASAENYWFKFGQGALQCVSTPGRAELARRICSLVCPATARRYFMAPEVLAAVWGPGGAAWKKPGGRAP